MKILDVSSYKTPPAFQRNCLPIFTLGPFYKSWLLVVTKHHLPSKGTAQLFSLKVFFNKSLMLVQTKHHLPSKGTVHLCLLRVLSNEIFHDPNEIFHELWTCICCVWQKQSTWLTPKGPLCDDNVDCVHVCACKLASTQMYVSVRTPEK